MAVRRVGAAGGGRLLGPITSLYAAVGAGFLVARTAGVYAVTLRLERPAGAHADCMARMSLGNRGVLSDLELDMVRDVAKTLGAGRFDLQPGLYAIGWAFSCWRDHAVVGPGTITVLIGRPGEQSEAPARAGDIVR